MDKENLDIEQIRDLNLFIKCLEDRDFSLNDSFWIGDIEFCVKSFKKGFYGDDDEN